MLNGTHYQQKKSWTNLNQGNHLKDKLHIQIFHKVILDHMDIIQKVKDTVLVKLLVKLLVIDLNQVNQVMEVIMINTIKIIHKDFMEDIMIITIKVINIEVMDMVMIHLKDMEQQVHMLMKWIDNTKKMSRALKMKEEKN